MRIGRFVVHKTPGRLRIVRSQWPQALPILVFSLGFTALPLLSSSAGFLDKVIFGGCGALFVVASIIGIFQRKTFEVTSSGVRVGKDATHSHRDTHGRELAQHVRISHLSKFKHEVTWGGDTADWPSFGFDFEKQSKRMARVLADFWTLPIHVATSDDMIERR